MIVDTLFFLSSIITEPLSNEIMASRKFFSNQNGFSQQQEDQQLQPQGSGYQKTNGHHHYQNGTLNLVHSPKVVIPEMAFFCFDVLHKELHGLERHAEPHILGISNHAL